MVKHFKSFLFSSICIIFFTFSYSSRLVYSNDNKRSGEGQAGKHFKIKKTVVQKREKEFQMSGFVTLLASPTPFRVGIEARVFRSFGMQAYYGLLPEFIINGYPLSIQSFAFSAQIYPFEQSLFFGLGLGSQKISTRSTHSLYGQSVSAEVNVKTLFFTPYIGYRFYFESGFMMGLELGYQFAMNASTSFTHNANAVLIQTEEYKKIEKDVLDIGNQYGKQALPFTSLLMLGWMF